LLYYLDITDQKLPSKDEEWKRIEREAKSENEQSSFTNFTSISNVMRDLENKARNSDETNK
jgi:hypothetical protein